MSIEDKSSWISFIFMGYLDTMFKLGSTRALEMSDLGEVSKQDRSDVLVAKFRGQFELEMKKEPSKRSLWGVLWRTIGHFKLVLAIFLFGVSAALQFGPVLVLTQLVRFFSGVSTLSPTVLWILVALLFVFPMMSSITLAHSNAIMSHIGAQVRNTLIGVIYRKSLVISPYLRQSISTGRIITMFSDDTNQIRNFLFFANNSIIAPFQIGAALYLIYQQVNVATFVGLGYQFFTIPIAGMVFGTVAKMRKEKMTWTDARVKLMNEVLSGIRIIKYYAWESAFVKKATELRAQELTLLAKMGYLFNAVFGLILLGAPQIQTVLIFFTFYSLNNQLDAATAFTTLTLFGLMTSPFIFLPFGLQQYNQSLVSTKRIMEFLSAEELIPYVKYTPVEENATGPQVAIQLQNAELSWVPEHEEAAVLAAEEAAKAKAVEVATAAAAEAPASPGKYTQIAAAENDEEVGTEMVPVKAATPPGINRSIHTLQNLSFRVMRGQLVGIVGPVGSGKSSILAALLGEMHLRSGSVSIDSASSKISYCDQRPWIINATVRDNILFGAPYDEERFNQAIFVASMADDIKILPGGVLTEIGERGINLSGGQKARVSLARAVYNNSDMYFLDDPLSAVDAHVGEHIFQKCIVEALHGKTRLLVTHHIHVLPRCDMVIILDINGCITAVGTFDEILSSGIDVEQYTAKKGGADSKTAEGEGEVAEEAAEAGDKERARSPSTPRERTASVGKGKEQEGESGEGDEAAKEDVEAPKAKALMSIEERNDGDVKLSTYWSYVKYGGVFAFLLTIFCQLACQVLSIEANFWLADWGKETTIDKYVHQSEMSMSRNRFWFHGYVGMQMASVFLMTISRVFLTWHRTHATEAMHENLLKKVLFFPVSFFDITPIGRVINRFSQDVATIDEDLAQSMSQVIGMGGGVLGAVGAIIGSTKGTFLILIIPLGYLYSRFQAYFRKSNTAIARLEAVSRSPIYADFSQTLSGTSTIRAYSQQERFITKLENLANNNTIPGVFQQIAGQWLAIRLDFVGSVIMLFMGALTAGLRHNNFIPAGYLALGLSYAIQLTSLLKMTVRVTATMEAQFNCVDRISHYCNNIPIEDAPSTDPTVPAKSPVIPPPEWPSEGVVEFENVSMAYRDGDLVLKNVSFKVNGNDKVGIAGRTGCGKSSLMVTLFRIEEVRAGRILLDGVDISKVPLRHLRSKLCIIPQDPVMFSATVRFNVDPFDEYSDKEVWDVLTDVNMVDHVNSLPNKLQEMVAEGGDNFSAGQRQLVCIARALLRKPKVLVMDEATASIDQATDNFIQQMIRVKFQNCTVLTIAHRLDTIIDSTKILVMDAGNVAEFDAPKTLLSNPAGSFRGLWDRHIKEGK